RGRGGLRGARPEAERGEEQEPVQPFKGDGIAARPARIVARSAEALEQLPRELRFGVGWGGLTEPESAVEVLKDGATFLRPRAQGLRPAGGERADPVDRVQFRGGQQRRGMIPERGFQRPGRRELRERIEEIDELGHRRLEVATLKAICRLRAPSDLADVREARAGGTVTVALRAGP